MKACDAKKQALKIQSKATNKIKSDFRAMRNEIDKELLSFSQELFQAKQLFNKPNVKPETGMYDVNFIEFAKHSK